MGRSNSHSTTWGYENTNNDGEAVEQWAEAQNLDLIHDAKLPKSFNSKRWKKGYNTDLAFVSSNIVTLCNKLVLQPIPPTQHRPIGIKINAAVMPKTVPFQPRFNYTKANWQAFSEDLESYVGNLEPTPTKYDKFIELVHKAARNNISRGCRTSYIPNLTNESARLHEEHSSIGIPLVIALSKLVNLCYLLFPTKSSKPGKTWLNHTLNIIWHGKKLKNTAYSKYFGVTLDQSLTFKKHIQNCKAKVCRRNNILRKFIFSHWGASPHTLRISAFALCYSAAEYACPVWSR